MPPPSCALQTSKANDVALLLLEALKHLWGSIVQRDDPPDLHDDFFARGGTSLAAAIFAARVTDQLRERGLLASGRSLSVVTVMHLRTAHKIAHYLVTTGGEYKDPVSTASAVESRLPFRLTPIQESYVIGRYEEKPSSPSQVSTASTGHLKSCFIFAFPPPCVAAAPLDHTSDVLTELQRILL